MLRSGKTARRAVLALLGLLAFVSLARAQGIIPGPSGVGGSCATLGGDLSGTCTAATVAKAGGQTITLGGALVTGGALTFADLPSTNRLVVTTTARNIGSIGAGSNGQILLGVNGSAPVWNTMNSDCTITNSGAITCLKTNGTAFTSLATAAVGQIPGTTTNDTANAGNVGEILSTTVPIGSAVSLVSATAKDVCTLALTAGDWDVTANIITAPNAATTSTTLIGSISTSANTQQTNGSFAEQSSSVAAGNSAAIALGRETFQVAAGGQTLHLVVTSVFAVNTMAAYGKIIARRVR